MAGTARRLVTVIEWLSHLAVIEAESPEQAEEKARELWANHDEHAVFAFENSGIESVMVNEVRPRTSLPAMSGRFGRHDADVRRRELWSWDIYRTSFASRQPDVPD